MLAIGLLAVPLSHSAISAKKKGAPPEKVAICHFPDDSEVGHVIEVSENAVPAHVSKHGDCTEFVARPNGACRCLTCEESCQRAARRCLAECADGDTACQAACQGALTACLAECEEPPADNG
jgi:hypothetical protein